MLYKVFLKIDPLNVIIRLKYIIEVFFNSLIL